MTAFIQTANNILKLTNYLMQNNLPLYLYNMDCIRQFFIKELENDLIVYAYFLYRKSFPHFL